VAPALEVRDCSKPPPDTVTDTLALRVIIGEAACSNVVRDFSPWKQGFDDPGKTLKPNVEQQHKSPLESLDCHVYILTTYVVLNINIK